MIIKSQFKVAWWLANPHAQTIYAAVKRPVQLHIDKMEQFDLPDGDFLNLAWSTGNLLEDSPLVIILHGLGGCVNSSYVARFMQVFNQEGWRSVLMHFRGAGQEPNRLPRAYHSGDTLDLDYFIQALEKREPGTKKIVVGISLGGNVLLKWLGEKGSHAKITAAIAVSVPFVLKIIADRINVGFSRFYQAHFLNRLKKVFARKADYLKEPPEAIKKAQECRCFWTFDHQVTAPLHGFHSVHAYYRESSSRQYLKNIAISTLIIHSLDDPFMTEDVLPTEEELSDSIILELSKKGGHVGFISGYKPGFPIYWLDRRIVEYIKEKLESIQ